MCECWLPEAVSPGTSQADWGWLNQAQAAHLLYIQTGPHPVTFLGLGTGVNADATLHLADSTWLYRQHGGDSLGPSLCPAAVQYNRAPCSQNGPVDRKGK